MSTAVETSETKAIHLKQTSSNKAENLHLKPLSFETAPHESSIGETILLRLHVTGEVKNGSRFAKIFQDEGDYCLGCWQERTHP